MRDVGKTRRVEQLKAGEKHSVWKPGHRKHAQVEQVDRIYRRPSLKNKGGFGPPT